KNLVPITTVTNCQKRAGAQACFNSDRLWLWAPACAGATTLQEHLRKIDRRARADMLEIGGQPRRRAVASGVAQAAQQAPFRVKLRRSPKLRHQGIVADPVHV